MSEGDGRAGSPLIEVNAAAITDPRAFEDRVIVPCRPVILRGLVREWPVVREAGRSAAALHGYLAGMADTRPIEAFFGDAAIRGRYFYGADLAGFNFERRRMSFAAAVDAIFDGLDRADGQTIYVGSVPAGEHLPGFAADNPLRVLPASVAPRIWLGHVSNVSCHYDTLDNIACVVAGRRRFTLYPPDTIADLYVGPIHHTMAGQPVSLAAADPDPVRYPRFAAARERALTAELEAGDAIYMPKLWWHQVEALAPLNGLVNYWWDATGSGPDAPYTSMLLAMIAVAERPRPERQAWRAFFDHYVFREEGHPLAHLDPDQHGLLGPLRPQNYGRIRAAVMNMLRGN